MNRISDRIILCIFCSLMTVNCHAEYDVSLLKKMFTDKQQRARIDAARSGLSGQNVQQANEININGYVTRSGGRSVVWVNEQSTLDDASIGNIKVQQSSVGKNKKVTISVDGVTRRLKPGETWNKNTGKILDAQ